MNIKKMSWQEVALVGFVGVWGFGNVVNNYADQGLEVIFSWIFIMLLYFLPYILMVGELGSTFSDKEGGVTSWIKSTKGAKLAYFAAWTYFVVHIPYMAQKPQSALIALSWALNGSEEFVKSMSPLVLQSLSLIVFIVFVYISSKGINSMKVIASFGGICMIIMSILYTVLGLYSVLFLDVTFATSDLSIDTFIPTINFTYLTTLSLLVFSVGGVEKISPYVKNTKNAGKNFPKAMIAIAILVVLSAIIGSITMGAMFDANNIPEDLKMNGQYYAFANLGDYIFGYDQFGSNIFMRFYGLTNFIGQLSVLLISIDAPIKMLLLDSDNKYVPKKLTKLNKYGAPINGYLIMTVLVSIIIMIPVIGSESTQVAYDWLLDLNKIVMPLRYLWVFAAYIFVKTAVKAYKAEYVFTKNKKVGIGFAVWCFGFTAFACILGMFPKEALLESNPAMYNLTLLINFITPVVLIGLGFILPMIAKKDLNK